MDGLKGYGSGSGSDEEEHQSKRRKVNAAPFVDITRAQVSLLHDPRKDEVFYNPKYNELYGAMHGPTQPHHSSVMLTKSGISSSFKPNTWTGRVEECAVQPAVFDNQFHTFMAQGYAANPEGGGIVGDADRAAKQNGATVFDKKRDRSRKRKRKAKGDSADPAGYLGPWAPYEDVEEENERLAEEGRVRQAELAKENGEEMEVDDTTKNSAQEKEREDKEGDTAVGGDDVAATKEGDAEEAGPSAHVSEANEEDRDDVAPDEVTETSKFHGTEFRDYQGRTYMSPPSELKKPSIGHTCYLPKKRVCTWTGHNKGVNAVRLFPGTGHLLLSAGLDGKVKLWDVYNKRRVLRTFLGHAKGVRDITFNNDGTRFLSASYDRYVKLWDTETGQCISKFSNRKIPYVVKFNPDADKQHMFLAGCNDKKIIQWDTNTGEITQEYDRHLGPVSTITFVDENRRFVTTSDDKSIRVWEWNIPVDIKFIREPHMHAMPSVALHPDGKWMAVQSLDNQILVYATSDRFRLNKKKHFKGHSVAGFACQLAFSPDGRFLVSGDGGGKLVMWDWKTSKLFKKLQCHDAPCIDVAWHPIEPSRVVTCGWDAAIHYWD